MNTFLPLFIIVALGFFSGLVIYKRFTREWPGIFIAAAIATVLWCVGVYIMLWLAAPNELGPPLIGAIFMIYMLSFAAAAIPVGIGVLKQDPDSQSPGSANPGQA